MDIIISNGSDQPIYEQVSTQLRRAILTGELAAGERLPSMRALANDLRVSVITTKRAYAELERAGLIETVQGKGCFVAGGSLELVREERLRGVEELLSRGISAARDAGVADDELREMFDLLLASDD